METDGKTTLHELIAGIVVGLLLFLPGNLFVERHLAYTLGLLLGAGIAVFMSLHMYASLEQAMLYDKETATKKTKRAFFVRMLVMVLGMMAAALFSEYFSLFGVVLGILTLKFAAYLQPLTHKIYLKILRKGR